VLVTEFLEPYLRPLRLAMAEFGLHAETTQGEGGVGQAEMNFAPGPPVRAADGTVLFKHAAKAIAHQHSRAVTFMAKPDQHQPGSGCHLHLSLRDEAGSPCTAAGPGLADTELSERARRFLAGVLDFSPS
jgi:glutamine synthetase